MRALPHATHPKTGKLYKVPVEVRKNNSQTFLSLRKVFWVIARNATDAANYMRDQYRYRPETEILAYGPKGGEVYRYVGWESAIGNAMLDRIIPDQGKLDL